MQNKILFNEIVLMCAFRYALGRQTYVVGEVAEYILQHSHILSAGTKDRIKREITEAEYENGLGAEMDAKQWHKVRNVLMAS